MVEGSWRWLIKFEAHTRWITAAKAASIVVRFLYYNNLAFGLGNNFIETYLLRRDAGSLEANRFVTRALAGQLSDAGYPLSSAEKAPGGWLLRAVPVDPVLEFIAGFQNHPGAMITDPGPVRRRSDRRLSRASYSSV